MAKKPYFSLFKASPRANAWRISWPHISTSENLHAKQKPVFSVILRLLRIFWRFTEIWFVLFSVLFQL
jgi:hypothetical protein